MKRILTLLLAVTLLCNMAEVEAAGKKKVTKIKTCKEGKTYTLTGKVKRINYEHSSGRHFIVYLLKLDKKIKINTELAGKVKTGEIQLAWMYNGDSKKNKFYKLRGKRVKVRGKVYGNVTSYYAVPIYINMKSIKKCK